MDISQLTGRAGYIAVKQLTKIYGVTADIYFPIQANNLKHGYKDDDIEYPEEAEETAKVLIPTLFKSKTNTESIMEDFEGGEMFMYTPAKLKLPYYAKVVARLKSGKIMNFKIEDIPKIYDDEGIIFQKYTLIPFVSIDIERNRDEFNDMKEYEDELEDDDLFLTNDNLISEDENRGSIKYKYDPIN